MVSAFGYASPSAFKRSEEVNNVLDRIEQMSAQDPVGDSPSSGEAVRAAVTPDVLASAGDLISVLEDLAPAGTRGDHDSPRLCREASVRISAGFRANLCGAFLPPCEHARPSGTPSLSAIPRS